MSTQRIAHAGRHRGMTQEIHTYLQCKRCLGAWQTERLEVGFTPRGILLSCRKHGQIAHFTPEQVAEQIAAARASGATHRARPPPTGEKRG